MNILFFFEIYIYLRDATFGENLVKIVAGQERSSESPSPYTNERTKRASSNNIILNGIFQYKNFESFGCYTIFLEYRINIRNSRNMIFFLLLQNFVEKPIFQKNLIKFWCKKNLNIP